MQVTTFYRGFTVTSISYSFTQRVYGKRGEYLISGYSRQDVHKKIDAHLDGHRTNKLQPTGDAHRDRLVENSINMRKD